MSGSLHDLALPLVVAALLVVAGCTGSPGASGTESPSPTAPEPTTHPSPTTHPTPTTPTAGTPDPNRETLEPLSFPWKPEPLRAGNVEVYVREYERTVRYNEAIGPSVTDVELTCQARLVAEIEAGYLLRAECAGSIHRQSEDGTTSVGAYAPEQATYVVGDEFVQRVDGTDHEVDPYRADGENVASPEGIAVVNADDRDHELRLAVRYDADDTNDSVLMEQRNLTAGEGLNLQRVAGREGTYDVTVELDDGTAIEYRWRVASDGSTRPGGIAVVVTPGGDLLVVDLPRMR